MSSEGSGDRGQDPGGKNGQQSFNRSVFPLRLTPHGFKGFTLLEVLLATAILAIIVTVIYTSFSTAGRNVEQAELKRDRTDLARSLLAKLSDDITNAYYNPSMKEAVFYGKRSSPDREGPRLDSVALTTLTNWRKPDSKEMDLWEVGYRFDEKPDGKGTVLVRREKRDMKDSVPLEGGVDLEITDGISELMLRYSDGTAWTDDWDSRNLRKLPRMVEIRISLQDGSSYVTLVEAGR